MKYKQFDESAINEMRATLRRNRWDKPAPLYKGKRAYYLRALRDVVELGQQAFWAAFGISRTSGSAYENAFLANDRNIPEGTYREIMGALGIPIAGERLLSSLDAEEIIRLCNEHQITVEELTRYVMLRQEILRERAGEAETSRFPYL